MAKNTIPPKSTVDPETVIKVVETAYNVLWSSIEIAAKAEEDPKLRAIFAVINFVHDGSFAGLSSAIGDTPAYANVGSTAVSITAGSWATGLAQRLEMAPIAGGIAATAIGVAAGFLINLEYNFINENQENIVNYFLNAGYTLDDTISRLSQAVESATQSGIDALDTAVVSAANALSGIPQYTEQFTQTLSSAVTQILGTVESSVDSAATTINDGAISLTQIISNINSSISSDVSAASDWISNATTALVSDPDAGANDTAALQALSDYTSANSDALPTDIASSVQSIEAVATGDPVALADGLTAQICSGGSITINSATDSGSVTGTYNLSGGLIAGDYELNDGTSQLTSYTVRGASITDDYSGPEGTGAITGIDVDSGNYDLSANISVDGTIEVIDGGTFVLSDGGDIASGCLSAASGGVFETGADQYATLNGVTIAAGTTFTGEDGSGTGLYGTIVNDGTLALTSTGDATVFSDGVQGLTLDGTGKVLLGSSGDCAIENLENSVWADPLVIGKGQTIEGSGSIYGSGSGAIDNQGTIVADYATALDVGSGVTNDGTMKADGGTLNVGGADVTNNGTIEAAFGSAVYISSDVGGDGAYDALGNSSSITFDTGVTVDGTIGVDDGANLVLDDTTITTDVSVGYDSSCYASGSVDNDSDMSFGSDDGDGGDPVFQAVGNTTLSGIGMLHLGSATQNFVYGPTGAGQTLIIGSAQTVEGSGLITDVKAGNILNEGTLIANHSAALSVGARVTNDGTIEASTGGVFDIEKPGLINDNIIEAIGGTVSAVGTITGARGVIDIGDQGAAVFSGAVDATQTVTFLDETGYLSIALRHSTSFSAEITGFQSGDIIDLKNVTNTTQSFARGALTFTDKTTHAIDAVLDFSGTPNFVFAGDNDGGTLIGDGYISASAVANSSKMKFESDKSVSNKSPIPYQASALTDRTFYSATDEFAALTLSPKGAELGSFAPYLALGAVAGAPPYLTHDGIGTVTLVRSGSFYPVWMFPNFH